MTRLLTIDTHLDKSFSWEPSPWSVFNGADVVQVKYIDDVNILLALLSDFMPLNVIITRKADQYFIIVQNGTKEVIHVPE